MTYKIEIEKLLKEQDGELFKVTVSDDIQTVHTVSLTDSYLKNFLNKKKTLTSEELIEEAFLFLLAREPNTAILSSFDLQEIEKFFPEFKDIY